MAIDQTQLQSLLDKKSIEDVLKNFCRALDRLDEELLCSVFHEDAELDFGPGLYQGEIEPFIPFAMEFQGAMSTTQHYLSNTSIELQGDSAFSESYVYAYHIMEREGKRMELVVGARYVDRLQRRDRVWRIKKRTEVIDWGYERELDADWLKESGGLNVGEHSAQDLSYKLREQFRSGI